MEDCNFPEATRQDLGPLQAVFRQAMVSADDGRNLVEVMGDMEARARDLVDITRRLIQPVLGRQELRELLLAFQ
jgi:hypothetical protein